jgi:hypothetical protein
MVYSNKFVMAVLVNDQIQKELANGVVPIPFDAEYSLRFRNKNNCRAVVKFSIDGENVSGNGYVIPANDYVDIQRHFCKDARFKFVTLDSPDAVDHGKNGPNWDGSKGVIEAKFWLEKPKQYYWHLETVKNIPPSNPWPLLYNSPEKYTWDTLYRGMTCSDSIPVAGDCSLTSQHQNTCSPKSAMPPPSTLQEGCTVEGSMSHQSFTTTHIELNDDYVALKLILKGFEGEVPVVKKLDYCTNCGGKKSRKNDRFCGLCGHKF